eukprot:1189959-Prorocentrum_minimum.AAC.1
MMIKIAEVHDPVYLTASVFGCTDVGPTSRGALSLRLCASRRPATPPPANDGNQSEWPRQEYPQTTTNRNGRIGHIREPIPSNTVVASAENKHEDLLRFTGPSVPFPLPPTALPLGPMRVSEYITFASASIQQRQQNIPPLPQNMPPRQHNILPRQRNILPHRRNILPCGFARPRRGPLSTTGLLCARAYGEYALIIRPLYCPSPLIVRLNPYDAVPILSVTSTLPGGFRAEKNVAVRARVLRARVLRSKLKPSLQGTKFERS